MESMDNDDARSDTSTSTTDGIAWDDDRDFFSSDDEDQEIRDWSCAESSDKEDIQAVRNPFLAEPQVREAPCKLFKLSHYTPLHAIPDKFSDLESDGTDVDSDYEISDAEDIEEVQNLACAEPQVRETPCKWSLHTRFKLSASNEKLGTVSGTPLALSEYAQQVGFDLKNAIPKEEMKRLEEIRRDNMKLVIDRNARVKQTKEAFKNRKLEVDHWWLMPSLPASLPPWVSKH